MKAHFNLKRILEEYNIAEGDIAGLLFPNNRYPVQALKRILDGEAYLTTNQVEDLARHLGVLVADLYNYDIWHGSHEKGVLTFNNGPYKACLNKELLTIYKDNTVLTTDIINTGMELKTFINHLNKLIYGNN